MCAQLPAFKVNIFITGKRDRPDSVQSSRNKHNYYITTAMKNRVNAKVLHGFVTFLLSLIFISRVLNSSIIWMRGDIGTIQEQADDDYVILPTIAFCNVNKSMTYSKVEL